MAPAEDAMVNDSNTLDVSVVLPVYNEAENILPEVERVRASLDASEYSYEIIVVDDGSTDGSDQVMGQIDGIRVIRFPHNRGSGSVRKAGTLAARGRVVVWTDVDMTYPNDQIAWLVKELDGYDQVVGARRSEQGTLKLLRVPAKLVMRKLAAYLTDTKIPDLNSGLRAFRRDVALRFLYLLPKGFSCVTTLTMSFLANGHSVKYVPIDYFPRSGESKFHWWDDSRRYLLQIVRMILLYNPLRIFMPVGLTLLGIGVAKLVFDVVGKDFRVASNTLLIFMSALMVIMVGLLSDLMVQLNKPKDESYRA